MNSYFKYTKTPPFAPVFVFVVSHIITFIISHMSSSLNKLINAQSIVLALPSSKSKSATLFTDHSFLKLQLALLSV